MKNKNENTQWVQDYLFDKFSRVKRDPEYVTLCEKLHFNDNGLIDSLFDIEASLREDVLELCKEHGIESPFKPSIEVSPQDLLNLFIFKDPFAVLLITKFTFYFLLLCVHLPSLSSLLRLRRPSVLFFLFKSLKKKP